MKKSPELKFPYPYDMPTRDELVESILQWWDKHEYDCDGSYNRYNEPPKFVYLALKTKKVTQLIKEATLKKL